MSYWVYHFYEVKLLWKTLVYSQCWFKPSIWWAWWGCIELPIIWGLVVPAPISLEVIGRRLQLGLLRWWVERGWGSLIINAWVIGGMLDYVSLV